METDHEAMIKFDYMGYQATASLHDYMDYQATAYLYDAGAIE